MKNFLCGACRGVRGRAKIAHVARGQADKHEEAEA